MYTGKDNTLVCPICQDNFNAPNLIMQHIRRQHQVKEEMIEFVCNLCTVFRNPKSRSVATHRRYCTGVVEREILDFPCALCETSYATQSGLTLHVKAMHLEAYNSTLVAKGQFKWTNAELKDLAIAEIEIQNETGKMVSGVLRRLADRFPHRTYEAIAKIKQGDRYRLYYHQAREAQELQALEDGMIMACIEKLEMSLWNDLVDSLVPVESSTTSASVCYEIATGPCPFVEDYPTPWDSGVASDLQNLSFSTEIPVSVEKSGKEHARADVLEFSSSPNVTEPMACLIQRYVRDVITWPVCQAGLSALMDVEKKNSNKQKHRSSNTVMRGNRRDNRNTRKWQRYKFTQQSFFKDKGKTVSEIIAGSFSFEAEPELYPGLVDIESVYKERLETVKEDLSPPVLPSRRTKGDSVTYGGFKLQEIKDAIKDTKVDTAAGPDGWKVSMVKLLDPNLICQLFNKWYVEGVPRELKECWSLLLHKSDDRELVNNYRPLTIGSILIRLYAKIWDKRMRAYVDINPRQKAFVPVDGCFENVNILKYAIKQQRKKRREINIVFLDLAKAFDTVTHKTIIKALRRQHVPEEVVSVVMDLYSDATTMFKTKDGSTARINLLAGVKQGCPLSPLLFNIVMNELIEEIQAANLGMRVAGELVGVMAFADDLVLLAEDEYTMKKILHICERFFDDRCLTLNVKKCLSLRVTPTAKNTNKKAMKVITEPHRQWKGNFMPSLTFDKLAKYLGINMNDRGEVIIPWDIWDEWLVRLTKAALKPFQKIDALRTFLIPKMIHQLRLAEVGISKLKELNRRIKIWYKKTMHLAEWTPDSWLHSETGGGLSNILELILKCRKKASEKMSTSSDEVSARIGIQLDDKNRISLERINNQSVETTKLKQHWEEKRLLALKTVLNGNALITMTNSVVKRTWLWTDRFLDGRSRTRCLQMLSGTIPTRINQTRGVQERDCKMCRRCKATAETDMHILSSCSFNKGTIINRHDNLVKIIEQELVKQNRDVRREKTWRIRRNGKGMENVRPDLSIMEDGTLHFVEVTSPYEKSTEYINQRMIEKDMKYNWIAASNVNIPEVRATKVTSIAVGACGTITEECKLRLKKLGITSVTTSLQKSAMRGSAIVINCHLNN